MSRLNTFLSDLKQALRKSAVKNKIISVILYGSAARGEFVRGASDIDLIVITKSKNNKEKIGKFIDNTIKRLNKKHDMKLKQSLARADTKNPISKLVAYFAYSITILSKDEIDLENKRVTEPRIWLITFIIPLSSFLYKIKQYGRTIHGKDLIRDMKIKISWSDRLKMVIYPYLMGSVALLSFLINPDFALKLCIKATLNEMENQLFIRKNKLTTYHDEIKIYEKTIMKSSHLHKTIEYRDNIKSIKTGRLKTLLFLLSTYAFAVCSQACSLFSRLLSL